MENGPESSTPGVVTPPPAPAPIQADSKKGSAYGPVLSIVVIVLVLVAGAFYVWNERLHETIMPPESSVVLPDGSVPTVGGSADVRSGENGPEPI